MKYIYRILFAIGIALVGLWFASVYYFPKSEIHYRFDVTFEVDGAPVTGRGVQRLTARRLRGPSPKTFLLTADGEAVVVDLPGHSSVFVLMTSPTPDGTYSYGTKGRFDFLLAESCDLWRKRDELGPSGFVRFLGAVSGSCTVPLVHMPLMVTFGDETDPTSVKRVYPNHPERALGPDVRFTGATVTIVDPPVTTGIGERLTWLSKYPEPRLTSGYTGSRNPTLADTLWHGYFRRSER